ncbi:MAG: DUF692 family multinuclear iron-containing protein [Prochlorococcaceae cyanobacterium]
MCIPRPTAGLLVNPTPPDVMAHAGDLVEHLSVIPERLFYDFGPGQPAGERLCHPRGWIEEVVAMLAGRPVSAHSFGLSLPSVMPLDGEMVDGLAEVASRLGGFAWFSEHLNVTMPSWDAEPHSNTSIALPISYDQESYRLLAGKIRQLRDRLGCRVLMENPATIIPLPEMPMTEPEFLNQLHRDGVAGTLLDLHNLLVSARNGGPGMATYLSQLDPRAVEEVHLAGGDAFDGVYTDSHSRLTPEEIWEVAEEFLPRCPNLRAITFEYNESYFEDFGIDGVAQELQRMGRLCRACGAPSPMAPGGRHVA